VVVSNKERKGDVMPNAKVTKLAKCRICDKNLSQEATRLKMDFHQRCVRKYHPMVARPEAAHAASPYGGFERGKSGMRHGVAE
jgi:hypothetical protein